MRKNLKLRLLIEFKRYIHLDSIHARNLKFGLYIPYMYFHKSARQILKILLFGNLMGKKRPKLAAILDFWPIFAHKIAEKQHFQKLSTRFVDLHIRKVQSKFQGPSMYAVQINVPFVLYQ